MKTHTKLAIAGVAVATMTSPAIAQDLRTASESVVACQSVEATAERLACFETAAQTLSEALAVPTATVSAPPQPVPSASAAANPTSSGQVPLQMASTETAPVAAPDAAEAEPPAGPPRRRLLPSWVPTVSLSLGNGDAVEEPDFFETEVTRIQRNKLGRHFFTTADGQVWRQIQIKEIRAPKALPAEATIRQTLSGSIRLEIEDNGRSYAVNRVE